MSVARVLLDIPSAAPQLGFDRYAQVLASTIEGNRPNFAVGIFGSWGTGKTTLMDLIERHLDERYCLVVRFNAWRYQREEHLIVPLLDAMRETLAEQASSEQTTQTIRRAARRAAVQTGRVVTALSSALEFRANLPLLGSATFRPKNAIDSAEKASAADARAAEEKRLAEEPRSLYFRCFRDIQEAFQQFFSKGPKKLRVVVFVDDLDRCLPSQSLEVLETMKLFFEMQGFVFVLGLDRAVVEMAVESHYRDLLGGEDAGGVAPVSGEQYVEKLFQVPFTLPSIDRGNAQVLLDSMMQEAEWRQADRSELRDAVLPHLRHLFADREVNPRELKRFVNQFQIVWATRGPGVVDRNVSLTLLTLGFRPDWRFALRNLESFGRTYVGFLDQDRQGNPATRDNDLSGFDPIPTSLSDYLKDVITANLFAPGLQLQSYLRSTEAVTSDTSSRRGSQNVVRFLMEGLNLLAQFDPNAGGEALTEVRRSFHEAQQHLSGVSGSDAEETRRALGRTDLEIQRMVDSLNLPEDQDREKFYREAIDAALGAARSAVQSAMRIR